MSEQKERRYPVEPRAPAVLTVDVGGSHVKVLLNGLDERRRFASGNELTAEQMVAGVLELTSDWHYEGISVGVPAPVADGRVTRDPYNLGEGWAGFDFEAAFGTPTKVINDATMQALGSYDGGRMLFLGLGTGLGSTMILRKAVLETIAYLTAALEPEYVVLGGGNARELDELPPNSRLGRNEDAFLGGFRLWIDDAAG